MSLDREKIKNTIEYVNTCNIIDIINYTIFLINYVIEDNQYSNYSTFKKLQFSLCLFNDNIFKQTHLYKLSKLNIDYNLLQSNMIGFSPINSNMWEKVDLNVDDYLLYNDLTKYNVGDVVKFKDNFYKCKNTTGNVGLFKFYDIIDKAINCGLISGFYDSNNILINEITISNFNVSNITNIAYVDENIITNPNINTIYVKPSNIIELNNMCDFLTKLNDDIPNTDIYIKDFISVLNTQYKYLLSTNDVNGVNHKLPRCYDFVVKKIGQDFNYYRFSELKEDDTLDLSEKLREFTTNDHWKNNDDLWSLIAAACNEIGSEFYSKIKKYISNISDVETCNIKGLKSIAKSINYDSNILQIYNNFTLPKDLKHLIDLFSINKRILFDQTSGILSESSVADIIGYIDVYKNYNSNPLQVDENKQIQQRLPYKTIYKIKNNIIKLENVLNKNIDSLLLYGNNIINVEYWSSISDVDVDECDSWSDTIEYNKDQVVYLLINNQQYFFKAKQDGIIDKNPLKYLNIINLIKNIDIKHLSDYQIIDENQSNVFVDFIHFIQQNLMLYDSVNTNWTVLDLVYINEKTNAQEYLLQMVVSIIQNIQQYDLNYKYQFVMFHIFGLFYSKIFNYELDPSYNNPTQSISEYNIEDFVKQCEDYVGYVDIVDYFNINNMIITNTDDSITLTKNLTQNNLEFIKYTTILFNIISDCDTNNTVENKLTNNIYKHFYLLTNEEQTSLLKHIIRLSNYLTDFCIKLSYEREIIKKQIKIYALSGTSQIIENVLSDYFLNNFSTNDDNIFSGNLNNKLLSKDQLTNPLTPFSIEFVEYQDNTNYFNIDANLPQTIVGQKIIGYETYIHESINNRGELVQTEKNKPIYKDVYSNQQTLDVNDRYWESTNKLSNGSDIDLYKTYYNQWLSNDNELETYLTDTIPFINDLYNIFNPSGTGDVELDNMLKFNNKSKINSNIKNYKNKTFPSIAKLQFLPNLTESSNTYKDDSLILSKTVYDSSVQYLNAILIDIINNSDYNRDDYYSIIKNGWKSDLVEYNGYASNYEDSNNKNTLDLFSDKRIDVDGPWVYSSLQQFLFMFYNQLLSYKYNNENEIIPYGEQTTETTYNYIELHNQIIGDYIDREFVYDQQLASSLKNNIITIYKQYLFNYFNSGYIGEYNSNINYDEQIYRLFTSNTFKNISNSRNKEFLLNMKSSCILSFIQKCTIFRFENDIYNNQYTLFKRKDYNEIEDVGQLWVRLYNHPISIPFEAVINVLSNSNNQQSIANIANNCLTFKCIENTMWMLGYDINPTTNEKLLKLVIFNFTYNSNNLYMYVENNSINYISNNNDGILSHINSYIGDYVDSDNNIHILIYNYSLLNNQKEQSYKFNIYDYKYNPQKEYIEIITNINSGVGDNNVVVREKPLLLEFLMDKNNKTNFLYKKHLTSVDYKNNNNQNISYKQNHIWSVNYNKNKNQLYIGYEFYNDNFNLTSNEILPVDNIHNGYQKYVFTCPIIQYKVEYEKNKINDQLNSNIAKKLFINLDNKQYELYYKSDADTSNDKESFILERSIIELKNKITQQSRNSVLCVDVITVPIWTLVNDVNISNNNSNTTIKECNYIFENYIQQNTIESDIKSQKLLNIIKTYFNNFVLDDKSLLDQIKNKLNNFNDNIFNLNEQYNLLDDDYYDINSDTYNNCINLFNDCMNCMNQIGLMKFNFTTKFNTENIDNQYTLKTLQNINNVSLYNNNLDLDISVRTLINGIYSQTVGWKCMNTQSSNINWISSDNTSGGPELVTFDVVSQIKKLDDINQVTYPICAHWFSKITSSVLNSIEVFYKGYYKEIPFIVLPYDTGCSINNILNVNVNFNITNGIKKFNNIDVVLKDYYYGVLINWINKPFATVKVIKSDDLNSVGDYTITDNVNVWNRTSLSGDIYNAVYHNKINYYICNESIQLELNNVDISNDNYWAIYQYPVWNINDVYTQDDIVSIGSKFYKCIKNTIPNTDITNEQYWLNQTKEQLLNQYYMWNVFNDYNKGDVVVYNHKLYVCIKDINIQVINKKLNNTQFFTPINIYNWFNDISYSVGDVVKHNSNYYRCIKNIINPNINTNNEMYWTIVDDHQYDNNNILLWNVNNTYNINDIVKYITYYKCIKTNNNVIPNTENDSWELCLDSNIIEKNNINVWKKNNSYSIGDVVGCVSFFKCVKNSTTNINILNTTYWNSINYKYQHNDIIYNYENGWDILTNSEYVKYLNSEDYKPLINTIIQTTGNINNDKYNKVVDDIKIIYSTNNKFDNSYEEDDVKYIRVGKIKQTDIINEYVNNLNNFATVQIESYNNSINIVGFYLQSVNNQNEWNCIDNNNNIKYTAVYNRDTNLWVLKDADDNIIPVGDYKITTTLVKDINIRQYTINKMYYQIKVKLFDNINKQIMCGDIPLYSNVYNDQKFTLLNNTGVDNKDYFITLYNFINISSYNQYNDYIINNIIF